MLSGQPRSRFKHLTPAGRAFVLAEDHRAVVDGRTLFPKSVVAAGAAPRILVSGANQRKLGDRVSKGPWAGMPIFSVTLEERATCPRSCHNWRGCFGNGMPFARRIAAGPEFERALALDLRILARRWRGGFVIRLHILGDFYSRDYVALWERWLEAFPQMRCFGYTAWPRDSAIGAAVAGLAERQWSRFAIRFSTTEPGPDQVITITDPVERRPDVIVCPAQTNRTASCGSCGLCWAPAARNKTIAFIAHGARHSTGPRAANPRVFAPSREELPSMSTVPVLDTAMLSKMLQLPPARRLALLERALLDGHSLAEALALAQKAERFIAGEHVPAIEMPIQAGTRPVAARRASKPPQSSLLVGDDLHAAIAMFRRGATNAEVGDAFNIENLQQVQGMRLGLGRGGHL